MKSLSKKQKKYINKIKKIDSLEKIMISINI